MAMAPTQVQLSLHHRSQANTKTKLSKKYNFMYSFRPVYYFSRVYGLMPFTITFNSRGKIRGFEVGPFDILWFILTIVINLTLALLISKDTEFLRDTRSGSIILVGGDYSINIFSMIFNAVLIVTDMCLRHKLVDILKKINTFDEKVSRSSISILSKILYPFFCFKFVGCNNWNSF